MRYKNQKPRLRVSHCEGTGQTLSLMKIPSKGTRESVRGSPSKRVAGTVVIATAHMPLKGGTAQLRVHDATSTIKWDIFLSRDNQVHETEDAFSPTSVGGVTAHT